jgi:hypothetical protein
LSPVYSSPKSGSAAAATAPARIAQEFDGQALWRTAPDGTTEVVTLRGGVLQRYRVHEDGTASLVDSSDSLGRRFAFAALALGAVLFVGAGLAGETALGVVGWLLWMAGIATGGLSQDLGRRAHRAYGGKGEWHAPTNLQDWTPRTSPQLTAVEQIAEEHGGVAYVSDLGARTVDVVAVKRGRLERYWIDEAGRTELTESSGSLRAYIIDRVLMGSALLLFLALLAVVFAVEKHKVPLILVLLPALGGVLMLGWRNDPEACIKRGLKRGGDGRRWTEIRTREPDGGE